MPPPRGNIHVYFHNIQTSAWPIKAKFYVKHLYNGGINVYINNLGHMTKMAAMPIDGKNPSKIFFSETNQLISRKLGVKHRWLKYYNVYINHDPVMTLTKFMARSTWVTYAFELGKLLKCHLKGKASRKLPNGQNIEDSEKREWPKCFICPCTGVEYHNIQTCLLVYAADLR